MQRLLALDGLRGIAALTVLLGHLAFENSAPSLGVLLFFVLSGFLMGRLYIGRPFNPKEIISYVGARFGRVYPLFAFVILAIGAVMLFHSGVLPFKLTRDDILPHLLLAGSGETVWTISVEFQFYAVFLVVWLVCSVIPAPRILIPAVTVGLLIAASAGLLPVGRIDLLRYLHVFFVGLSIAVLMRQEVSALVRRVAGVALLPLILIYLIVFFTLNTYLPHDLVYSSIPLVLLCGLVVMGAVAGPQGWAGRLLSLAPVAWLGEVSFGIYLLHRPVEWMIASVFGLTGWPGVLLMVAVTLVFAWLANLIIERPARTFVRRLVEQRFTSRQPETAAPPV